MLCKRVSAYLLLLLACTLTPWSGVLAKPTGVSGDLQSVTPVTSCERLVKVNLVAVGGRGSKVQTAERRGEGAAAVCLVTGVLAPSITFQVSLPMQGWTQRFLQVGCGGLCGRVSLEVGAADGCVPLKANGFVLAGTDMGHQGGMDGSFAKDPQKRVDFAYRAQHLTALAAKRLIQVFYGQAQRHAYFSGCSDGGREALMEAQRFPDDFDGIIAGAAAMNFQSQNGLYHAWVAASNRGADGKAVLVASRLPVLHEAVLKACDELDGVHDGLITDPRVCHFDPASIQCPASATETSTCLRADEVVAARRIYEGPRDPTTGVRLLVGGPQYGSELAWAGVFVPFGADQAVASESIAQGALPVLYADDSPSIKKLSDLTFTEQDLVRLKVLHPLNDATNPDLRRFFARGGKLILWHGWSDPHISPRTSIAYHEALLRTVGSDRVAASERLYLLPGVNHCSGGEGPSAVDFLTPMLAWVEQGQAPDRVEASTPQPSQRPSGFGMPNGAPPKGDLAAMRPPSLDSASTVQRSRPLYPYPAVARYDGQGDPNLASSFVKGMPLTLEATPSWAGEGFFSPYQARMH
ncbi:tannase/feruloyl esterase family alpha/beta hydrolase [Aquabacterium sp.]|uniref:tannase/feruloyl esterase family alpha/beta hydrolase n=1 Tax=Aquabacterium sp. TaxID=1872578 RepID=UPI0035AE9ABF